MAQNNEHNEGVAMDERRGTNRDEQSDHDRLIQLEGRVDRIYNFIGVIKDALGLVWAWLVRNVRGGGGNNHG